MCTDGSCGRVTVTDDVGCMGVGEGMAIAGALSAAGTAYSANQANQTSAGNAGIANMTNMVMQAQNQDYNSAEALKNRQFNSYEASMARDFNDYQGNKARDYNTAEAQKNRDFQERMSNTQYQRAIGDMKAAGLNPMLAYSQGGAGNVNGSAASVGQSSGPAASGSAASSGGWSGAQTPQVRAVDLGQFANTAVDLMQKAANVRQTEATTKLTEAQVPETNQRTRRIDDEIKLLVQQTAKAANEAQTETERRDALKAEASLKRAQEYTEGPRRDAYKAGAALDEARTISEKYGWEGLKNTEDLEKRLGSGIGGGSSSVKMLIDIVRMLKGVSK